MTDADKAQMDVAAMQGWSMTQWTPDIKGNALYTNGIEYQSKVMGTIAVLRDAWGSAAVDSLLAADPNLIQNRVWAALGDGADANSIREWARKEPEFQAGAGGRFYQGDLMGVYQSLNMTPPDEATLNADVLAGTTPDQLIERLRSTPEYQTYFLQRGCVVGSREFFAVTFHSDDNRDGKVVFHDVAVFFKGIHYFFFGFFFGGVCCVSFLP